MIEKIQKCFITYNLKIEGNIVYVILLLEASIYPFKSMVKNMYLIYKNNLNNIGDKRIPNIASYSS